MAKVKLIAISFIVVFLPQQPAMARANSIPSQLLKKNPANTLTSWKISGAIAAKKGKKGWTAALVWIQQGQEQYQIRLIGPLGGGTAMIEKKNHQITYHEGLKHITSNKAEELLQRQTGVRLPVNSLYYWVRGIAAPGRVSGSSDDGQGHLLLLRQDGYQLDFSKYVAVNGYDLPGKIQLKGHGVSIKLLIKHWSA